MIALGKQVSQAGSQAVPGGSVPHAGEESIGSENVDPKKIFKAIPFRGNVFGGQFQAPVLKQQAAYGTMRLPPSQGNPSLNFSGQPQEVQNWISVPPATQY